jgi:hypothetical protein
MARPDVLFINRVRARAQSELRPGLRAWSLLGSGFRWFPRP